MTTEFITDKEIYDRVVQHMVVEATNLLWIATADIKDMHVKKGRRFVPFLEIISDLIDSGVSVRLLHAKEPGPNFRKDFDRFPNLIEKLERMLCPRVHFKCIIVDGVKAYTGSANLTGAGLGAKSEYKRNFESGIMTDDTELVQNIMNQFDRVWIGDHCQPCGRRKYCPDCPLDD